MIFPRATSWPVPAYGRCRPTSGWLARLARRTGVDSRLARPSCCERVRPDKEVEGAGAWPLGSSRSKPRNVKFSFAAEKAERAVIARSSKKTAPTLAREETLARPATDRWSMVATRPHEATCQHERYRFFHRLESGRRWIPPSAIWAQFPNFRWRGGRGIDCARPNFWPRRTQHRLFQGCTCRRLPRCR